MRERLLFLALVCIIAMSFASAEFSTETIIVDDTVLPGQAGTYEIHVTNLEDTSDSYSIASPEYSYILTIDERPSSPVNPGDQGVFVLEITPRSFVNYGSHRVPLEIRSRNTGDVSTVSPILVLRDPDSPTRQYAPSIALSVGVPETVDPREDLTLRIGLRNRNAREYDQDELTVRITTDFLYEEYRTSLGPVTAQGEKTTERELAVSDTQPPGEYDLLVEVVVEDEVISSYEGSVTINGYKQITRSVYQDQVLFKTKTTYELVNEGNTVQTARVERPVNVFKQVFTSSSHNYEIRKVDGQRMLVVEEELVPLQEVSITITHNYRLLVLLILLAIASVIGYYILRSPVVLEKEAELSGNVDENTSELKTRLFIKNRGSQTLRNVRVVDRVSGLADVIKNEGLGTLKPTKVVKKKSQGTLIRWDIESLEPFEERIISYTVHTPLALVGDITLPSLKVTFEQENGRQRTTHSNDVSIRRAD